MPKQIGTHRVIGTTGNMTYIKTKDASSHEKKPSLAGTDHRSPMTAFAKTMHTLPKQAKQPT